MTRLTCALGPDAAGTLLHRFIRDAEEHLDVAMYEVGPRYAWMFPAAVQRGVRVRLLLDGHGGANRGCLEELERAAAAGTVVPCRVLRHSIGGEAHWKLLTSASGRMALGTGNLIERDAPFDRADALPPDGPALVGTREWWAFIDGAPTLAAQVRRRVTAAWREAVAAPRLWPLEEPAAVPPVGSPAPAVAPLELELSPRHLRLITGGRAILELLEELLEAPARRVLVTQPYVHTWALPVRPLLERLTRLSSKRSDVRLLLGSEPSDGDLAALRDRHISTRVMNAQRSTTGHAKGLVVDGSVVISSANWSAAGLGNSLEAALRVDSPAAADYYAEAFARDWESADPVAGITG